MSSSGNFVTCSAKHIAFNIESGGKNYLVLQSFSFYAMVYYVYILNNFD